MKNGKNVLFLAGGILMILTALFLFFDGYRFFFTKQEQVITIGVFSDSYWEVQNGYSYQILDDAIALFEEQNPGVRVEYVSGVLKEDYPEWICEHMLLGTAPDLFFIPGENFNDWAQAGALKDLSDFMERDESFNKDVFYSSAFAYGLYEEKQYALPYECAPKLMFVNESILNEEGIPIPSENWTWDEFYKICEEVTRDTDGNGTLDQFGTVGYTWSEAFEANGVNLFNAQGTECYFADERVEEAITFIENLEALHEGYQVTDRDFDLGKVVFQPMLFSEYRAYKSYPLSIKKYAGFEWECIAMPAGPSGSNISGLDTLMIAMNANTDKEKYAWEFMKMLTMDERIQSEIFDYSEGVSVVRKVTESDNTLQLLLGSRGGKSEFHLEILSNAVENAVVTQRFRNYGKAVSQVNKAVEDIIAGNSNISMEQIIWNRKLNNFLKDNE